MRVKRHKCKACGHPSDNHSAYRDLCLHEGCGCTTSLGAVPYQGTPGHLLSGTISTLNRLAVSHV